MPRCSGLIATSGPSRSRSWSDGARSEGHRPEGEALEDWLARLHKDRRPVDHLGQSPLDDVADPVGQGPKVYEATATELAGLTTRLADLLWPPPG